MKRIFYLLALTFILTACVSVSDGGIDGATPVLVSPTSGPTATETATARPPTETPTPEKVVTEGSEAAGLGIPVGSELGQYEIYRKTAPTGVVEVGKVENGKITPEAFLGYKIYDTYQEALQNKWPLDLVMNGKAGDLCQLTADPLPENVVTRQDVDAFVHNNPDESTYHELRWSKEAQEIFNLNQKGQPVNFCGYVATESAYDEPQKDYIAKIYQWKNKDGSYVYITLLYNKFFFNSQKINDKNIFWPAYVPPGGKANDFIQDFLLMVSIMEDPNIYNLINEWKESNVVPQKLQDQALIGGYRGFKAK